MGKADQISLEEYNIRNRSQAVLGSQRRTFVTRCLPRHVNACILYNTDSFISAGYLSVMPGDHQL